MNDDTIKLLKECNAGCKSATNSMEQVLPYINDTDLRDLITKYNDKHIRVGDSCHSMLNSVNEDEKSKIADLMIDGCNMGIKSLSKYLNQYKGADSESIHLTQKLIKIEQDFMHELLVYL